jgi:hypothetical protein
MEEALLAIIALSDGNFDNAHLQGFGALSTNFRENVKHIAEQGLIGETAILDARGSDHG